VELPHAGEFGGPISQRYLKLRVVRWNLCGILRTKIRRQADKQQQHDKRSGVTHMAYLNTQIRVTDQQRFLAHPYDIRTLFEPRRKLHLP